MKGADGAKLEDGDTEEWDEFTTGSFDWGGRGNEGREDFGVRDETGVDDPKVKRMGRADWGLGGREEWCDKDIVVAWLDGLSLLNSRNLASANVICSCVFLRRCLFRDKGVCVSNLPPMLPSLHDTQSRDLTAFLRCFSALGQQVRLYFLMCEIDPNDPLL